jgi:serine phosphatase RsbU (regulator of sigma subunit)
VGGNDAGGDSGESQRKGGQIGALSRRGFTLNQKFVLLALLVSLPITVLFGMVAVSDLEKQLLDEIKRSGYQQALVLNGFGRHVVARFKGAPNQLDFDNILTKYKAGGEGDTAYKDDREYIKRMVAGDKRIKDVAIFASAGSVSDPNVPVLRGDDSAKTITTPPSRSLAVNVAEPDPDIFIYWGDYGGENCLYFRVPLVKGSGTDQSGRPLLHSMGMVIMSAGEIDRQVASLRNQLVLFGLLLVGAGVGLALGLAGRITRPINALVDDINIVAKGDLDYESDVPNQTSDEVGLLAGAFNRMTRNLRDARDNERDRERIESELNSAKAIHARLLPEKIPQLPGIDIGTAYNSAKEVGGDYYDFIPVGDIEHLALCVADVSGKGIPGSMVMGTTRTILRMMAVNNLSAMDVLSKTNYHVARDIKRGMFVTCMYAILNVRTKEMTVASAGHNPMLIWRAATRTIEKVRPNGIALGFDKGPVFNRTIREQKVPLQPGDRVVLYTDGVVESMNAQREEWGDEALDELTLKYATQSSKEYVRLLVKALEEHQGQAEQHDDITIMTFRIS